MDLIMQLQGELEQLAAGEEYRMTAYEKLLVKYDDNPKAVEIIYELMDAEGGM